MPSYILMKRFHKFTPLKRRLLHIRSPEKGRIEIVNSRLFDDLYEVLEIQSGVPSNR